MLYIGHFSFDEIDVDGSQGHGYLSSIVAAENPDEAIAILQSKGVQTIGEDRLLKRTP